MFEVYVCVYAYTDMYEVWVCVSVYVYVHVCKITM